MSIEMKGFFIYTDKGLDNLKIDVNFNLWHKCGWKDDTTYLDIGVMVHEMQRECTINILLPFIITLDNLISLDKELKNAEIV